MFFGKKVVTNPAKEETIHRFKSPMEFAAWLLKNAERRYVNSGVSKELTRGAWQQENLEIAGIVLTAIKAVEDYKGELEWIQS